LEADPPRWLATWLGRPATTWCLTDLSKLVGAPFAPINTHLMVKVGTHTHHILEIPLAKLPFLL
jgi:hypothetical protein